MMKNKIKELIKEAGFSRTFEEERLYRLVVLTIKECASIANKADPYQTSEVIYKHFGIDHENNS